MSLRPPTAEDIRNLGQNLHFDLTEEEIEDFVTLVSGSLEMYETVRELGEPDNIHSTERKLDTGTRARENDPYNAWITRCDIQTSETGRLAGWDVGLKDNISLAGTEMTCGSHVVEGYIPDVDGTIVKWMLDEGARITGKNNMDNMALAGNGSSSAFGPTLNPQNPEYLSGGSSGGSATAVAIGEVDLSIGTDQGGSVRVPAAWSGVVGFKPSYGLVPFTGIVSLENSVDHIGTFTQSVEETAEALTVLAGKDPKDPRQPPTVPEEDYREQLTGNVTDMRVAVLEEGFTRPEQEDEVNERVRAGIDVLADEGATVEDVSVPLHDHGADIYTVAMMEGMLASIRGEGLGHNWKGWYNTGWAKAFGKFRRAQGGDFPPTVKLALLTGAYTSEQYYSQYYTQAMNLRNELTEAYDNVLEEFDILALPTAPQTAQKHKPDLNRIQFISRAWTSLTNVSPFNPAGFPALSVPVEPANDLPVGLQLVGSTYDDASVLNVGHALERAI